MPLALLIYVVMSLLNSKHNYDADFKTTPLLEQSSVTITLIIKPMKELIF